MGPAMVLASSPLPPNFPRVQISFRPFRCTNWTYFDRILANLLLHCFPKAFLPQFCRLDRGLLHVGHRRGLFFPMLFPLRFGVVPLLAGCDCDSFRFFRLGFFASFDLAVRIGVNFHWNGDGYWNRVRGAGGRRHDEAVFGEVLPLHCVSAFLIIHPRRLLQPLFQTPPDSPLLRSSFPTFAIHHGNTPNVPTYLRTSGRGP